MKSVFLRTIVSTLFILVIGVVPVFAQSATVMTDQHVARIKSNCQLALTTLGQIHTNDAPSYINRNQTYYSISDKLMSPLNARLILNHYDVTTLVQDESVYNNDLQKFRDAYKNYDDLMSSVLRVDCTKEPVSFYDQVTAARDARQAVHDDASTLTADINKYKADVHTFELQHFVSMGTIQ